MARKKETPRISDEELAKAQAIIQAHSQQQRKVVNRSRSGWRTGCVVFLVVLVIGGVVNILRGGNSDSVIPTRAALPSETPFQETTDVPLLSTTPLPSETIVPADTHTPVPSSTNTPSLVSRTLQDDANAVAEMVGLWAGGRNVAEVRMADGRANGGERSILVSYLTQESTEAGYVDEWIDLLDAIAIAVDMEDVDADSISLIMGSPSGNALGIAVCSVADAVAYRHREISRAEFVLRIQFTAL